MSRHPSLTLSAAAHRGDHFSVRVASVTRTFIPLDGISRRDERPRWASIRHRGWRSPVRVPQLGRPRPPEEPSVATYDTDGHHVIENMQVDATAYRAHLAEERVVEREARLRGVNRTSEDFTDYLNLVVDVHQRLAERRLARAYRPVMIRAPRPRGRARRVQRSRRTAVRRATADSGGSSDDGDPEPPGRREPRARGPPRPRACARLARSSSRATPSIPECHLRVPGMGAPTSEFEFEFEPGQKARRERPRANRTLARTAGRDNTRLPKVSSRMRPKRYSSVRNWPAFFDGG